MGERVSPFAISGFRGRELTKHNLPTIAVLAAVRGRSAQAVPTAVQATRGCRTSRMTQPDVPSELECSVCLQLLHEPASLPCGHSFCLSCVRRSLSSNRSCPLCRRACYGAVQTNLALTHALRMLYPNVEPRRRSTSHADVAVDSLVLPCFLSSAVEFPGNHVRLHLFETRYRILSQRALEGGGEFAICFAAQGRGFPMMAPPQSLVGTTTTVFLIEHSRSTPDGRFFLVARGQRRARVVETWVDHEAGDLYVVRLQPIVESDNNMPNHIDVSLNGLSDEQLADNVLFQMRTMGFGDVGGRPEEDGGVVGVDSPPARRALSWRAARGLHLHDGAAQHRLLAAATTRERLEHLTRLYDAALRRQKHPRRWSFCSPAMRCRVARCRASAWTSCRRRWRRCWGVI